MSIVVDKIKNNKLSAFFRNLFENGGNLAYTQRTIKGKKEAASLAYGFSQKGYVDTSNVSVHVDAAQHSNNTALS